MNTTLSRRSLLGAGAAAAAASLMATPRLFAARTSRKSGLEPLVLGRRRATGGGDAGNWQVGTTSTNVKTFTITNNSGANIAPLDAFSLGNADQFNIVTGTGVGTCAQSSPFTSLPAGPGPGNTSRPAPITRGFSPSVPRGIGFSLSGFSGAHRLGVPASPRRTVRTAITTRIRSRRHAAPSPRAIASPVSTVMVRSE
jgi:hypothetical protein